MNLTTEFLDQIRQDRRTAAVIAADYGVSPRTVESWRAKAHMHYGSPGRGVRPGTYRCVCPNCGTRHTAEETP